MDSPEESNTPSDYSWTKIKGDDGESGADAYTIILGNENISFAVEYESNIALSSQSYSSAIQVIQGIEERTDFTIGSISSSNGINVSKNDADKTIILSVQKGDLITSDSGYFRIPISIDGLIFYKDITWSVARQGQPGNPGHSGEGALNIVLANESQTIACTSDGLVSENVLINIPFMAFKGLEKVPCSAVVGVLPSGITLGSNTPSTTDEDGLIILNVAGKADLGDPNILSGYINLTFAVENQNILKRFIWTKTKDGKDGNTYSLELSSVIVNKNYDGTISPQSITLNAYYQKGNERAPYEGRFIIAQSVRNDVYLTDENNNLFVDENNNLLFVLGSENSIFENVYVSSKNESAYTYVLPNSISGLVCYLCKSDSVTNILDQQTVTVLNYIDDIKPIITEITTTMSGVSQKVDAVEKSITDKVWQTDITTQINNYDNTTTKIIRDRVTQVEQDIDGITSSVSDIESSFNGDIQELTTKISQVEQDANGFKTTVEQSYAKKDDLENEATSIRSEISQTASEINQSISDLEGNTSKISQDISSLTTRVTNTEGDVTELQQTASGIETTVKNNSGDIATLKQTAQGLQSDISTIQENIGELETSITQNAEAIELTASKTEEIGTATQEVADNLANNYYNKTETDAKIKVESDRITSTVSKVETVEKNTIASTVEQFYLSNSPTTLTGGSWSNKQPTWTPGKYIWRRNFITKGDGSTSYTPDQNGVCITGNTGEDGVGIEDVLNYYLATASSSGVTTSTSGWTTTIQTISSSKKYLWNYEKVLYTDGSSTTTVPCIIGTYGRDGSDGAPGDDGVGISAIQEYYQVSSSGTTAPSSWVTTPPTMTATKKYLWNYEKITYTNGTTKETAKRIIGAYGDKGATGPTGPTGISITSVDVQYYLSTSATSLSGGSWSSTAPDWVNGKYMWSKTVTTLSNGTKKESDPVCITGGKGSTGATGATGKGVSSITEEYYLSTSKTTQTGGSWTTKPPTWRSGKYIWTRSKIVYTNPSSTVYTTPVCDSSWEAVNELEVGGRNLLLDSDVSYSMTKESDAIIMKALNVTNAIDLNQFIGKTVTLSFYIDAVGPSYDLQGSSSGVYHRFGGHATVRIKDSSAVLKDSVIYPLLLLNNVGVEKERVFYAATLTLPDGYDTITSIAVSLQMTMRPADTNDATWVLSRPKLELGNKATDWTPAPEDMATTGDIETVQDNIDDVANRVTKSESEITQLSNSISMLVTDENGQSLMEQTSDGWTFNIGAIQNQIDAASENITGIEKDVAETSNLLNKTNDLLNDVTQKTAYINMATDDSGNPCIELGKQGNPFKLRITNTSIDFMQDNMRIAYITNRQLYIEKSVVTDEMKIGSTSGFIWRKRANGNMGLRWEDE